MNEEKKKQIIRFIEEELERVHYGKLYVEITVTKGEAVNIQGETKKSKRLANN